MSAKKRIPVWKSALNNNERNWNPLNVHLLFFIFCGRRKQDQMPFSAHLKLFFFLSLSQTIRDVNLRVRPNQNWM